MGKIQAAGKKSKREELTISELRNWLIITCFWVLFVFFLYGTASIYYPEPIFIGDLVIKWYGDVGTAIIFAGFAFWAALTGFRLILYKQKIEKGK